MARKNSVKTEEVVAADEDVRQGVLTAHDEEQPTPDVVANGTIAVGGIIYHAGDHIPNADPAQLSEAIRSRLVYIHEGGAAQ